MAEPPDFDQIARQLVDAYDPDAMADRSIAIDITEQLRLIWNARGAADLVTLEAALSSLMGVTAAGPYVKNLDRALRQLDR